MAVFNVVHLTDLHFGSVPGRENILSNTPSKSLGSIWRHTWNLPPTHDPFLAERVAAWIHDKAVDLEANADALDMLVLSGDQATTGLRDDLDAALLYIDAPPIRDHFRGPFPYEDPYGLHLATIAGLAKHYFLIPGNHDRFANNKCHVGGTEFDTVFAKYWGTNTNGVVAKVIEKPVSDGRSDEVERLAIIGADFCLRSAAQASFWPFAKSQGFVYDDTWTALVAKTEEARQRFPGIAVIWVIHYPPHGSLSRHEILLDYPRIAKASVDLDVNLILSGHTHENDVHYQAGAGRPIWTGGSAAQVAEPKGHWIQFLEITVEKNRFKGAMRENYAWMIQNNVRKFYRRSVDVLP